MSSLTSPSIETPHSISTSESGGNVAIDLRPQSSASRLSNSLYVIYMRFAAYSGRYQITFVMLGVMLAYLTSLRLTLLLTMAEPGSLSLSEFAHVFVTGVRFDLLAVLCFALPQIIQFSLWPESRLNSMLSRFFIETEWLIAFLFLPFLCVAEFLFFDEFQSRLNYIAFEYLVYPTEVCCNIWESYPLIDLLIAIGLVGILPWLVARRHFNRMLTMPLPTQRRLGFLGCCLTAITVLWFTTDSTSAQYTKNRITNECSWNGMYSFVYYAWTCHFEYDQNYISLDEKEAETRLRQIAVRPEDELSKFSTNPIDRLVHTGKPQQDYNVVLILEESFGANFVGVLGDDRGLTPNFDELSKSGILFDNFYATGNRTSRALEAVHTSMPPIPTESILKRDHSERVFTLANVLEERGYERLFMTAGRGLFDGVRSFMTSNGYNEFREQSDFEDPVFSNAWGVSDEDLFRKSLGELDHLHDSGKPFLATLLTVSNHRPYTYPEGRIPENAQSRENAVKYADWALGYFFREARQHDFFKNTIFVVMGDHGARVYGSQSFPMSSYQVPVLMIHPDVTHAETRCHTLGCSLDIPSTVMGQLGGVYQSVFLGQDVLNIPAEEGRALMQHNHDVALLDAQNRMLVLGYGKQATQFQYEPDSHDLNQQSKMSPEMLANTAACFQSGYQLYYEDRWYPDVKD
ncbi:Lipoteichoic acid synthase 1 [Polystyrenella longa]|uniref:Lipoteichoic acid synthase 1 n=1 Tax=Polystyrenella longa TaxID=2528007 RepID=A0A518CT66_9PLAN|nr:alkaline phosphatase family protein [Polystyrenella longa]QDU82420.1 Lipoteichoic acid synthase 1 [Polystyrenella longa]